MKHLIRSIIWIPLIASSCLISIAVSQNARIDRLERALANPGTADTARVMLLNDLSKAYLYQNPRISLEYATKARELALSISYRRGLGYAYYSLASACLPLRDYQGSLEHSRSALAVFEKVQWAAGMFTAWSSIGRAHETLDRLEDARMAHQNALAIATTLGDKQLEGMVLNNLAIVCNREGKFDLALQYAHASHALRNDVRDSAGLAIACTIIGETYSLRNEAPMAIEWYEKSMFIAEQLCDPGNAGYTFTLWKLDQIYKRCGRHRDALSVVEKGRRFYTEHGSQENVAAWLLSMGRSLHQLGSIDSAFSAGLRALLLYESCENSWGIADACLFLGQCFTHKRSYTDAEKYYNRVLRIHQELKNGAGQFNALQGIAIVQGFRGECRQSLDTYLAALAVHERYQLSLELQGLLNNIGTSYLDLHEWAKALEYFQRSLRAIHGEGNKECIATTHVNIGTAYRHLGLWDQARESTMRGFETAKRFNLKAVVVHALLELSEQSFEIGDLLGAYKYHREYADLKDSLLNEANIRSQNEMAAKYQSDSDARRISLLEKDGKIGRLELERTQKQLDIQRLQSIRDRQRAELLQRDRELQDLELQRREDQIRIKGYVVDSQVTALKQTTAERDKLEAQRKAQQILLRSIIAGIGLVFAIGFLGIKRVQAKRTEATLRAEAAEYQAQAAKYQARATETEMLRVQAETERQRREAQQEFSRQLMALQEAERSRIAVELHDQLGQDLIVVRNRMLVALRGGQGNESLDKAVEATATMLENVRRLARDLRPYQLDRYGLTEALAAMISRVEENSSTRFTVEIDPLDGVFEKKQEIHVYRIVQESVNNVIRHAQATEATVRIMGNDEAVELVIADNGKGLTEPELSSGFGINGMMQRVEIMGGTFAMQSSPDAGTKILVSLPIPVHDHVEAADAWVLHHG